MKVSKNFILFFSWLLAYLTVCASSSVFADSDFFEQQIIGTQAIGASYHFTADDAVIEQAKKINEMGSNMIKISVQEGPILDAILEMPFNTYFFWWRSTADKWQHGLSEADKAAEYKATYEFAKKLLTQNPMLKRTFYLGNWEGDWYLIHPDNQAEPDAKRIQGMIDWVNIRQKAVDDARNDVGTNSLTKVYYYVEVNRVRDAMVYDKARVVNKVLPNTNVDYISYSSYDVQREPVVIIKKTLDYIEGKLHKKTNIEGRRVFIGECGIQAKAVDFNPEKHEQVNRDIFIKFLQTGVPYILYWEMYNNEVDHNEQQGFWLINDKNQKQPLYYTLERLYKAQKGFKDIRAQSIQWLENRK